MGGLRSQRRLAAEILKVGESRIWINPEYIDEVEAAITREEIKRLIHDGVIKALPKKGVSRARARIRHIQRKKGRMRGHGSRSGAKKARIPKKKAWMMRIRAIRRRLKYLRDRKAITVSVYRKTYLMAKGGAFKSIADMERYLTANELWRRPRK